MKKHAFAGTLAVIGVALALAAGAAATTAVKTPRFDARFDCAKIAPAALFDSLAGGWGGSYGARDHEVHAWTGGGSAVCGYTQSGGSPVPAGADPSAAVVIVYGTTAAKIYNAKYTGLRSHGVVMVPGLGDQAFETSTALYLRRGSVFMGVVLGAIPNADGSAGVDPPADLLVSMSKALLARVPVK